jgi:hypothetical protein
MLKMKGSVRESKKNVSKALLGCYKGAMGGGVEKPLLSQSPWEMMKRMKRRRRGR